MNGATHDDYELLDSGNGRKLERFGPYVLARPAASAVWIPALNEFEWDKADAWFDRDSGNSWTCRKPLPASWNIAVAGLKFKLSTTAFGHLGIFPEQRDYWKWIQQSIKSAGTARHEQLSILNLFAYSGGSTLAAAAAGAQVCHLDASKGMVARARENAQLNGLDSAPIRWIVDDVTKFLDRELRRGSRYDGIILDPPSFGRGKSGEVYKIEKDLTDTLGKCVKLLSNRPLFLLLSCHTPAYTPIVMRNILQQVAGELKGSIESSEMVLSGKPGVMPLPSGTSACFIAANPLRHETA
jgi:23S rRNA (cytosine1962-C5)-methyltransferase